MTQRYVVGFMIDHEREHVALIRKNRPAWQEGKLNGIGGKVEPGESFIAAMCREFREETGLSTTSVWWRQLIRMTYMSNGASVFFYTTFVANQVLHELRSETDEEVGVYYLPWLINSDPAVRPDIIPNLSWMLPLAIHQADTYEPIDLIAHHDPLESS